MITPWEGLWGRLSAIAWTARPRMAETGARQAPPVVRAVVLPAAVLTVAFATATPCLAELQFCNRTDGKIDTAFGYLDRQDGWVSKGWYILEAGECKTMRSGILSDSLYYGFAKDAHGQIWEAPPDQSGGWFCFSSHAFTLKVRDYLDARGTLNCEKDNLREKQFLVIDTGAHTSYTFEFQ